MKKWSELRWEVFNIQDIFPDVSRGKRLKTDDHIEGQMAYVSSSAINNGVDNFISNTKNVRMFENCITIANSGSVGTTFFHPYRFIASDHVTKLQNVRFSKYTYLFLCVICRKLSEKYNFNREINDDRLKRERIVVPVNTSGSPDYEFMDEYMRDVEKRLLERYKSYLIDKQRDMNNSGGGFRNTNPS